MAARANRVLPAASRLKKFGWRSAAHITVQVANLSESEIMMESGFDDFLRQIPTGPIVMLCVSGILMIVALVAIVRARAQKAKSSRTPSQTPAYIPAAPAAASELPDLDMLIPASPPSQPPATSRPARKGTYSVALNGGERAEAVEVMAILRDVVDGGLIVQLGDKSYRHLSNDDPAKANFMKIMRELAGIVKTEPLSAPKAEEVKSPNADPMPVTSEAFGEPPSLRDLIGDSQPAQVEVKPKPTFVPPPPTSPAGEMPGDLPKYKWDDKPAAPKKGGLFRRGKLDLEPVPELNIAGAIEAYLQHKLKYTPGYESRNIHVHPAPDGGVSIEVDGKFYEAVGDVDETDVREFLLATIQEWQQRH
jgi:hypothetical protein